MATEGRAHTAKRVTLADVAAHAKVSQSLVSLVMRNAPGPSAASRRHITAAAAELGYRPDARARSLAGQSSRLIGVLFGMSGTFHFDLLEGLYAAAESENYGLLLSPFTRGRDEAAALESLHDFRFDALVMLGPPTARPLVAGRMPVVVVGWPVEDPDVDVVRTSDEHGMAMAVDHLAALGHRRIAHLDGGPGLVSASRRQAYVSAMTARGLGEHVQVRSAGETQLDGQRATRALLAERQRPAGGDLPTAIIAYNDDVAVAAIGVLDQNGIDVPHLVSVIGWDDTETAALSKVDLTSVAQRPHEMARLAVERLVARCEAPGEYRRELVLEPDLVVRSSTAPAAS